MSVVELPFVEPVVVATHLSRLRLVRSEPARSPTDVALTILRAAQLSAQESKLYQGGIVGGTSFETTQYGTVFEEAFSIAPKEGGFMVTVTGRGSFRTERWLETLEAAAREVVGVYTVRRSAAHQAVAS